MSEDEITKRTKKIYKIWYSNEHTILNKLKDFIIEVAIIVFAVSVSIWLNNRNVHNTEQAQVKSFLIGLKEDLRDDIDETKKLTIAYQQCDSAYRYLLDLQPNLKYNNDSLNNATHVMFINAWLRPNSSRYEGFRSSGKLSNIENDTLLQNILNFYQEIIPRIKSSESGWIKIQDRLLDFADQNLVTYRSPLKNRLAMISTPRGKYLCARMITQPQLYERYNELITQAEVIVKKINAMYKIKE